MRYTQAELLFLNAARLPQSENVDTGRTRNSLFDSMSSYYRNKYGQSMLMFEIMATVFSKDLPLDKQVELIITLIHALEEWIVVDTYGAWTTETAIYPDAETGNVHELMYLALGLGEAGEIQNKIKKYYRDDTLSRQDIIKELGDLLWYVLRMLHIFGVGIADVLVMNKEKLESRKTRGVLGGSGDER